MPPRTFELSSRPVCPSAAPDDLAVFGVRALRPVVTHRKMRHDLDHFFQPAILRASMFPG